MDYNKFYVHSELGYLSPEEFEDFYRRQISLKEAASGGYSDMDLVEKVDSRANGEVII